MIQCPACRAGTSPTPILRKADDGRGSNPIELARCSTCDTVFLIGSRAFDPCLYEYYERFRLRRVDDIFDPITARRYLDVLRRLTVYAPTKRVLDVGCGKGDFVRAALSAGWAAAGIELSAEAVEIGMRCGLPVSKTDFFSPEIEPSSVDVVTLFEVIEHVADPLAFLARSAEVVRPGGVVYVTTPNFASLDRRVLGSAWHAIHREHLTYFTPRTLKALAAQVGNLQVREIRTQNLSGQLLAKFRPKSRHSRNRQEPPGLTDSNSVPPIREAIESSWALLAARNCVNWGLGCVGIGESMIAILQRRPETA